jgi:Na+-transporting methylmalonyl-CoA/oxaloacetate decarboxylase gamma subunit
MKFRIIGTLFVLAVLAALAVVMQAPGSDVPTHQPVAPQNDTGLQPLKIN